MMTMRPQEDLGVEAKEAAVREVAKLLPVPESLASIASIKVDYALRQQANDAQLSVTVTTQVEQAQAGIEALSASQKTIQMLQQNFLLIDKLCQECQTLIENHDQIKLLSNARNNLNTTLKDIEGMMSISVEASEARDSLGDDRELVHTFERLTALDGKRRFALAAASSHKEEAGKLSPHTLVRALRVVEMQEVLDQQQAEEAAEAEGAGAMASITNPRRATKVIVSCDLAMDIFAKIDKFVIFRDMIEWYEGFVTEYLVATFGDYFTDVKLYIEERSFRRFVEACLEEAVVVFIDHLLTQKNYIREETLERMRVDEEVFLDFFREHINLSKIEKRLQPLADLRELASSESVESFTLVYSNILQNHPDCPPEVVEKIVALREGIPKKDAREVLQECKEIYSACLANGDLPKPGFLFARLTCLTKATLPKKL